MTEVMDLSLDDIIKMKKSSAPRGNRINKGNKTNNVRGKQNLQKPRPTGARQGIRKGGPKQTTARQQQISPKKFESTVLHVSNLHYKVNDKDIRDLFGNIGSLKKAAVHYDKSGRSLGTAEVIYLQRIHAIEAIKTYNQRALDGRPMSVALVPSKTTLAPAKSRIGIKPNSGIHKKQQQRTSKPAQKGRNPNRGRKPGTRKPKEQVTAEQLDADLEAYTGDSKMNTS